MALIPSANLNTSLTEANTRKISVQKYLTNCRSLYSCIYCRTHLANHDELVSRSFQGSNGRAYLFNSIINVSCGPAEQRFLNTGSHAVADIYCGNCKTMLGWKYEKAYVETQKYKEGKYVIEIAHVVRENRHLELDKGEIFFGKNLQKASLASPTYSQCSSPPSSPIENIEDELMFPFYEYNSSFPGSLSSSYHNKMRRSLYLDSTPYDWKHSATSTSDKQALQRPFGSLDSADLSPSTSSSSGASPEQHKKSYHLSNNNLKQNSERLDRDIDESETQFNFEADKPDSAIKGPDHEQAEDVECDNFNSGLEEVNASANKPENLGEPAGLQGGSDEPNLSTSGDYPNLDISLNLDDEEFFDCCTDHDVCNQTAMKLK